MKFLLCDRLLAACTLLAFATPSLAHHSFAPHFDSSKRVSITGEVVEFERRNPHAYLHIRTGAADGESRTYRCESFGITQLERNGITPDMLAVGTTVTVEGAAHRRDPDMCFFDAVRLSDGRELDIGDPIPRRVPRVAQRDSIYGTWLLAANGWRSSSQPDTRLGLTPEAIAAILAYDPLQDDPTYRCEPVAPRRVWFAAGTPLSITREGNTIFLRFEWMDVVREVHLNMTEHPADGERTVLGHSIGHFEGDTLVIETANFSAGVLRQYVEQPDGTFRGLLHSEALTVTERVWFNRKTNSIRVVVDQEDPRFFTTPFAPASGEFAATDLEIQPFGCVPEILN
jgi:Family of unknown function (DUF6152)